MKNFSKTITDLMTNQGKRDWIKRKNYRDNNRARMKLLLHLIRREKLDLQKRDHLGMYQAGIRQGYINEDMEILREVQ